jgi:hypothetical protein
MERYSTLNDREVHFLTPSGCDIYRFDCRLREVNRRELVEAYHRILLDPRKPFDVLRDRIAQTVRDLNFIERNHVTIRAKTN